MVLFGFKISKKTIIIVVAIIAVIVIGSLVSSAKKKAEIEKRTAEIEAQKALEEQNKVVDPMAGLSEAEREQQTYINLWGEPPEGFRWNDSKELVPVSADNLTNEDVVWNYLRALSLLDFATVQKYSRVSLVKNTYMGYFSDSNMGNASYYQQFLRKAYKYALTSIEVESVGNTAVFADGTSIVTVKLKMLDLMDKDFWQDDKDEIFKRISSIYSAENDSAKAQQYVYDYVYSAYEDGKVGKRDVTVELKLDKVSLGGWLISDDTDINAALKYEEGVNVASFIFEEYSDWSDRGGK